MYTSQDVSDLTGQLKKRWAAFAVPAIALLAGVVASFVHRIEWLTVLLTVLLGSLSIFMGSLVLYPVYAYRRFVSDLISGRRQITKGVFKGFSGEKAVREGVRLLPFLISAGNPENEQDDRLFYLDANLEAPEWRAGERYVFQTHEKAVADWKRAE